MDPLTRLEAAIAQAHPVIARTDARAHSNPTPCPDWDVRTLLNHMLGALTMFRDVATDGRADPAVFDADLVGDDAIDAVEQVAGQTTVAWKTRGADGIVALPFGDFPAGFALELCAMEMVVHAWDLATATNQLVAWDEDLVTNVLDFAHATFTSSESRGANFAPPVSVDEGGATIERLVGFLGRR